MNSSDYEQIWEAILASPFQGVYLMDLYWLAVAVVSRAEKVFIEAPKPTGPDNYLKVNAELVGELFSLLGDAARIKALLTERQRRDNQGEINFEMHVRRVKWLRNEVLKGVKLARTFEARVRNTLEHFDEYLDGATVGFATHDIPTPALVPIDFVVSRRSALEQFAVQQRIPHLYFMRVFIASERVFVNCGEEISIQALHTECRRIAKRLKPMVPEADKPPNERGTSMLVITDTTFPER